MRIGSNIMALNTYNRLNVNQGFMAKSLERISSGLRINSASDDAAGLAISQKMRAQIRGLDQANRNIQDGISLLQVADGGMNSIHSLLQRGRELSVQAANGTLSDSDKQSIQKEVSQIIEEVDNIARETNFNGHKVLKYVPVSRPPVDGGNGTAPTEPQPNPTPEPVPEPTPEPTEPTPEPTEPTEPTPEPTEPPTSDTPPTGPLTAEEELMVQMKSGMLAESEKMIEQYFGLKAENADIKIIMDDANDPNRLAWVSYNVNTTTGKGYNVELHLDMADFENGGTAPIYNDRVVLHEMTHAVMSQTMNYYALPKWFKEGTAEFMHGGDERLYGDIWYNGKAGVVNAIGDGTDTGWTNSSKQYSAGYAAVRYLHDRIKTAGGEGIKEVMTYLNENQNATLDDALKNIGHGSYSGGLTQFVSDFKANGVNFINSKMDLSNTDTGAIGGKDADGLAVKTAESVVDDTVNYQEDPLEGFNEIWIGSNGNTLDTSAMASMPQMSAYVSFDSNVGITDTLNNESEFTLQIGPNANSTFSFQLTDMTADNLNILDIDTSLNAQNAIERFDAAIHTVSSERGRFGAIQNRLEHALSVTSISSENLTQSLSRIEDADLAKEMVELTKHQILSNAAQSILAQANQVPQQVLQLLR